MTTPPPTAPRGPPPGEGVRWEWQALPPSVRETVEGRLGEPVRAADVQRGGFSPAFAGIVTTRSGREVFVKAGGPEPNAEVPVLYRREWTIASALPAGVPAPRALWFEDDGRWVILAFEAIRGGNPRTPWSARDLARVLRAHETMMQLLTPSPIPAPSLRDRFGLAFRGFRTLRSISDAEGDRIARLPPWVGRHLSALAELEAQWEDVSVGPTLLHNDVRADNIVLRGEEVFFVDWPHACTGPPFVDLMGFLPSVAMQGGPKPWTIFERSPLTRDVPPSAILPFLTAILGYFVERSGRPPPPGLPTLREFQRAQGEATLEWLRRLLPGLD
jgi:hypothetical protein